MSRQIAIDSDPAGRAPELEQLRVRPEGTGIRRTIRAYVTLTKPRIILLLLVTTVPAMILARRSVPSIWLIVATLAGGTLAAGGANAMNQYLDRDIDEIMRRTRRRPLPSGVIAPRSALLFGFALGVVAFVWLALLVNMLSAVLAIGALAFYVIVYTLWLKRSSPQNIVIGGAAGAMPVLVGWAAVTGRVGVPALVLFAIVFVWTPPHFWALALRYERDYAAARVPMLPVVAGTAATTRQIVAYTVVLVAVTFVLYPVAHMGLIYLSAAAVLGVLFVAGAVRLRHTPSPARRMALFHFSIAYLALLFGAVALDALVRIRP
jgi:protoheme IX farnesyltransferase